MLSNYLDEECNKADEEYVGIDLSSITTFEMAYKHFNNLWKTLQDKLAYLLDVETLTDEPGIFPDRPKAVRHVSKLYLRYIQVANGLIKCYEYIAHPQKRRLLRRLCDSCIGRTLELKHELVSLENSEFHFLDPILLDLRLLPSDMDIKIPEYMRHSRTDLQEVAEHYLGISRKLENRKIAVSREEKFVRMAAVMIRMIQSHERARQGREQFRIMQGKSVVKELVKKREAAKEREAKMPRKEAACVIQRAWRRYLYRKKRNNEFLHQMKFLGMVPVADKCNIRKAIEKDRSRIIKRNEEEYLEARENLKKELMIYKAVEMAEELEDKIRSYFYEYKETWGDFPELPLEEEGGSMKMFEDQMDTSSVGTPTEVSKDSASSKSTKDNKSEKSSKDDKSGKSTKSSKSDKSETEKETSGCVLTASQYLADLREFEKEYCKVWKHKKVTDFDRYDAKMLEEEVLREVELEVRLQVDEKMREELTKLQEALRKDSPKKKSSKKKGKKEKKAKKGKKEIDLTPNRSPESLIEELVKEGIIVDYPKYLLSEFWGDYNFSGHLQHMSGDLENDPTPCLLDIRRVVNEYCILPMDSANIHSKGAYVKSILFAGPHGVGKKSLVNAICTEIGATMMNLSAENIEGKYPGDEGRDMLLHLVAKVGRFVQPTVIFIKDAENYFYKKKPATCTLAEPGRLKKAMPKFLKNMKHEDRILICGTTVLPFDAEPKAFGMCYAKVLTILKPDYNCRRELWRQNILKHKGVITRELDTTVLCSMSDGFAAGPIERVTAEVLTERRLALQRRIPLSAADFIQSLAGQVPIYDEEVQEYRTWLEKMPLRKKRAALLLQEKEDAGEPEEESSEEED
ncbi:dynein regulatory complex protein 11-like [Uloborus diversus]|uniref:dynein regulatory complex protein 11-like n=1 Tax=Uloborus diversus TaxID=327109 RepID=UPI00240A0C5F|nr:dynein regulatory complex protein 11-like [Uloborus diversus]